MTVPRALLRTLSELAAYTALFALLAWPWLREAHHALPAGYELSTPNDARLIVWVLAWVTRALTTAPTQLFHAPIFYPAPDQLAGSESFLSAQVAFAPLFLVTGNATWATSLTIFLTYPLAGLAMSRLLRALGCGAGVAFVGGLLLALGPLRVPANTQSLQYPNFYLPWVALGLTRLRSRPAAGPAAALALALCTAALASYYTAVMAAVTALIWGAGELLRRGPGRVRFAALAGAAAASTSLLVGVVSLPYLRRSADSVWHSVSMLETTDLPGAYRLAAKAVLESAGPLALSLAAAGTAALISTVPGARRTARFGLALGIVAIFFMLGPEQSIAGARIPLPFALLTTGVTGFFRSPWRFAVVAGFGMSLLGSAALELASRRLPRPAAAGLGLAAAGLLLASRGTQLWRAPLDVVTAQDEPAYDQARAASLRWGPGPLLELPTWTHSTGKTLVPEAMVGSIRHGLPLLTGFTGYLPPHAHFLDASVAALGSPGSLEALVDATHLRWILLRPAAQWNNPRQRQAIAQRLRAARVASSNGWDIFRVDITPRRPEWFRALWEGQRPGRTVLGTPIEPLRAPRAAVAVVGASPVVPPAKGFFFPLQIDNRGTEPWPAASAAPGQRKELSVEMRAKVVAPPVSGREAAPANAYDVTIGLPRDVPAGDALVLRLPVEAPGEAGDFALEVEIRQVGSDSFREAGNQPVRLPFRVEPQASERGVTAPKS